MSNLFLGSTFFLSFFPLWISIICIDIRSILFSESNLSTEYLSMSVILVGALVSFVIAAHELRKYGSETTLEPFLVEAKEEKAVSSEYLLSYILPLFAFDFTKYDQVILFLIFFGMLACICIRHNYFCANIALEMAGYRLYDCKLRDDSGNEVETVVISKVRLNGKVRGNIPLNFMNNEFYIFTGTSDLEGND